MRRRDFVLSFATVGTVFLKSTARAQTDVAQAARTARLTDPSIISRTLSCLNRGNGRNSPFGVLASP
jgi:hypothetical protein